MTTEQLGLHPSFAVAPLISQSITVFYTLVEPTIFVPFLRVAETDRSSTHRVLRLWFNGFTPLGLTTIFSITLPAIVSALYAARQLPSDPLEWKLYAAGASFVVAHFVFVPCVISIINNICDEKIEKKGETTKYLRQWLQIPGIRPLFSDIPALLCFGYLLFGL